METTESQELKLMGGIYSLVESGQGTQEIEKFIAQRESSQGAHQALHKIKQYQQNITYESLAYSIDLWVETAMKLTERNLRMMAILTRRQKKKGSVRLLGGALNIIKNKDQNNNPKWLKNIESG